MNNYGCAHSFLGQHHSSGHRDTGDESGGMLSQMGSTFFGEDISALSLLAPSNGHGGPADASSPSLMAKSLLGKLALRKPSILSITSNLSSPGRGDSGAENKNVPFGGSLEDVEKGKLTSILFRIDISLYISILFYEFKPLIKIRFHKKAIFMS